MSSLTQPWQHDHDFHRHNHAAERGTRAVLWITLVAMSTITINITTT